MKQQIKVGKTLGDFHGFYLVGNVCLLTDVMENYRKIALKHFGFDPENYVSAPGLSWEAFLNFTKVTNELITLERTLELAERGKRGRISKVSHHFGKANIPHVLDYDPNKPRNYLSTWMQMTCMDGQWVSHFRWVNLHTQMPQ